MNPIFSIIIPHKGIPDLLMLCLKSIPVLLGTRERGVPVSRIIGVINNQ